MVRFFPMAPLGAEMGLGVSSGNAGLPMWQCVGALHVSSVTQSGGDLGVWYHRRCCEAPEVRHVPNVFVLEGLLFDCFLIW